MDSGQKIVLQLDQYSNYKEDRLEGSVGSKHGSKESSVEGRPKDEELYRRNLLARHGGIASSQDLIKSPTIKLMVATKNQGIPKGSKDFVKDNILKTSDMQAILEKFIIGKY